MLAIKLQRVGKKHQPSYRVVIQEKREKLNGRSLEDVGWWNPLLQKSEYKKERLEHWLKVGAQPTVTVWNLLVSAGIVSGAKKPKHKKPKAVAAAAPSAAPTAAPATEAKPVESKPAETPTAAQ